VRYANGVAHPLSENVEIFGTGKIPGRIEGCQLLILIICKEESELFKEKRALPTK